MVALSRWICLNGDMNTNDITVTASIFPNYTLYTINRSESDFLSGTHMALIDLGCTDDEADKLIADADARTARLLAIKPRNSDDGYDAMRDRGGYAAVARRNQMQLPRRNFR